MDILVTFIKHPFSMKEQFIKLINIISNQKNFKEYRMRNK